MILVQTNAKLFSYFGILGLAPGTIFHLFDSTGDSPGVAMH